MDVLRPDTQWIDGICYRINPGNFGSYNLTPGDLPAYNEEEFETYNASQFEDENDDEDFVEVLDGGRHKCSFHVAKPFFAAIIGKQGSTKSKLEKETRTTITIPKIGQDGDIVVTGSDKKSVLSAKQRIELIVLSLRRRQTFTHFISVPFNDQNFKNGFLTFKNEVLENCKDRGVDDSIFQKPEKLHLTVCLLAVMDDVERKKAASVLFGCQEDVVKPLLLNDSLELEMSGVDYMNDDPSEVDVLFGKVKCSRNPEILQNLADGILNYFVDKGLTDRQNEHVKLHVTLMNSRFRRGEDASDDRAKPETFDASRILRDYADFVFGTAVITHIDLSLRFSAGESGYYQATASIPIP